MEPLIPTPRGPVLPTRNPSLWIRGALRRSLAVLALTALACAPAAERDEGSPAAGAADPGDPRPRPLPEGLLARWTFDDPEELARGSHGAGVEARLQGGSAGRGRPLSKEDRRRGSSGALTLDGEDDHLRITAGDLPRRISAFSVEAWVRGEEPRGVVFWSESGITLEAGGLSVESDAKVLAPTASAPLPPARGAGGWRHLVGVFDRGEIRTYVDGRRVGLKLLDTLALRAPERRRWAVGARLQGTEPVDLFRGAVDELALYHRALAPAEIHERSRRVLGPPARTVQELTGAAIQQALSKARRRGLEVFLPAGTYRLQVPLVIPGGVMLRGEDGTVLKPAAGTGDRVSPMLLLNGEDRITLRDLTIDGGADELDQKSGHLGVFVSGCRQVQIDGLNFRNLGGSSAEKPGGAHLLIDAQEPGIDKRLQGRKLVVGRSSEGIVVEDSEFSDPDFLASFAIRLATRWKPPIQETFAAPVRGNLVKNNRVLGFTHNAVEIAGPGTLGNLIRGNTASRVQISAIEADKGARFNYFLDNIIQDVWAPGPAVVTAMRDQGTPPHYWNEGNVFRRNSIHRVHSGKWAAGILITRSRNGVFEGNVLTDIRADNTPLGAGIMIAEGTVEGYVYGDNEFADVANEVSIRKAEGGARRLPSDSSPRTLLETGTPSRGKGE